MGGLVSGQGEADDVHVVLLDGAAHGGTPAAADVEQRHSRCEAEFSEGEVDLGCLGLFERHVVALEVCAAVGLAGVQEQSEEVVGQVVVGLNVREMGLKFRRHEVPSWRWDWIQSIMKSREVQRISI